MTDLADSVPLRLDAAAKVAFPDGSMTASGLRREAQRGRLVIERVAGKDYTTLAAIKDMRERCRVAPKVRAYGSGPVVSNETANDIVPCSSSLIKDAKSRLDARLTNSTKLNRRSRST